MIIIATIKALSNVSLRGYRRLSPPSLPLTLLLAQFCPASARRKKSAAGALLAKRRSTFECVFWVCWHVLSFWWSSCVWHFSFHYPFTFKAPLNKGKHFQCPSLTFPSPLFFHRWHEMFHKPHPMTNPSNPHTIRTLEKSIITQLLSSSCFFQTLFFGLWNQLKWIDSQFLFLLRKHWIMSSELKAWMLISHQLMLFRENPIIDCCCAHTTPPYCFLSRCN